MQKGNDKKPYKLNFLLKVGKRNMQGHSVSKLAKIYDISPGTVSKARAAYLGYQKGVRDAQKVDKKLLEKRR